MPEGDIIALLRQDGEALDAAFGSVREQRAGFRYAPGKWSIRDVIGHLIDAERILAYRALRVSRSDATPLPGYDGDAFVEAAYADRRLLDDLRDELRALRETTVRLYVSLPAEAWSCVGTIDGNRMSVRAIAYVTVGHAIHHLRGLGANYGVASS